MAAVSHLKNKKEAKLRESLDKVLVKCSTSSGQISLKLWLNMLGSQGLEPDAKEMVRVERITDTEGIIDRQEFMEFAKKSAVMKEYLDGERSRNVDKAELAFKAIDKDGSGYIDAGELGRLGGKMDTDKAKALMTKLDKDGDGKINLEEFRTLFKQ